MRSPSAPLSEEAIRALTERIAALEARFNEYNRRFLTGIETLVSEMEKVHREFSARQRKAARDTDNP